MTARVTLWQKQSKVEDLDRPVSAVHIIVGENSTRVTLILAALELDYDLINGDEMSVRTNT